MQELKQPVDPVSLRCKNRTVSLLPHAVITELRRVMYRAMLQVISKQVGSR